jgi:hypothetical protein
MCLSMSAACVTKARMHSSHSYSLTLTMMIIACQMPLNSQRLTCLFKKHTFIYLLIIYASSLLHDVVFTEIIDKQVRKPTEQNLGYQCG